MPGLEGIRPTRIQKHHAIFINGCSHLVRLPEQIGSPRSAPADETADRASPGGLLPFFEAAVETAERGAADPLEKVGDIRGVGKRLLAA
jgi:hypothetical protein